MKGQRLQGTNIRRAVLIGFAVCVLACTGWSQPGQQSTSGQPPQAGAEMLPHLYWHFLERLSQLDEQAPALQAKGKDGNRAQKSMQATMGFNDNEFAVVRASSERLIARLNDLNTRLAEVRTATPSPSILTQIKALQDEREADISAEIATLKQELPPGQIKKLEVFLQQFFSAKVLVLNPNNTPEASAGVQQ